VSVNQPTSSLSCPVAVSPTDARRTPHAVLSTAHDSTPLPSEPSSSKRQLSPPPASEAEASSSSKPAKRARKNAGGAAKQDRESGVSRGVDFVSVACVLNFDLPTTTRAYTHRVGRTARAHQSGLAISFVVPAAEWGTDKVLSLPSAKRDEQIFERIRSEAAGDVKEWDWGGRKAEVEGFRYRMEDALRSVTKKGIQEARREEVRRELLNSEKLKVRLPSSCRRDARRSEPILTDGARFSRPRSPGPLCVEPERPQLPPARRPAPPDARSVAHEARPGLPDAAHLDPGRLGRICQRERSRVGRARGRERT
jgi:superfamily II DNA/RNA helicase